MITEKEARKAYEYLAQFKGGYKEAIACGCELEYTEADEVLHEYDYDHQPIIS